MDCFPRKMIDFFAKMFFTRWIFHLSLCLLLGLFLSLKARYILWNEPNVFQNGSLPHMRSVWKGIPQYRRNANAFFILAVIFSREMELWNLGETQEDHTRKWYLALILQSNTLHHTATHWNCVEEDMLRERACISASSRSRLTVETPWTNKQTDGQMRADKARIFAGLFHQTDQSSTGRTMG